MTATKDKKNMCTLNVADKYPFYISIARVLLYSPQSEMGDLSLVSFRVRQRDRNSSLWSD